MYRFPSQLSKRYIIVSATHINPKRLAYPGFEPLPHLWGIFQNSPPKGVKRGSEASISITTFLPGTYQQYGVLEFAMRILLWHEFLSAASYATTLIRTSIYKYVLHDCFALSMTRNTIMFVLANTAERLIGLARITRNSKCLMTRGSTSRHIFVCILISTCDSVRPCYI